MTTTFAELRDVDISVKESCALTGTSRATHYRHVNPKGPMHGPWLPRAQPSQALDATERALVLELLTSPAYRDLAIPQVWARELDEGRYWCSVSTMYRIARAAGQVRERRRVATHPAPDGQLVVDKGGSAAPGGFTQHADAVAIGIPAVSAQ